MRNGFIVIALLVAELFKGFTDVNKMTCDATLWTQNDVKLRNREYFRRIFLYVTKTLYSFHTHHNVP